MSLKLHTTFQLCHVSHVSHVSWWKSLHFPAIVSYFHMFRHFCTVIVIVFPHFCYYIHIFLRFILLFRYYYYSPLIVIWLFSVLLFLYYYYSLLQHVPPIFAPFFTIPPGHRLVAELRSFTEVFRGHGLAQGFQHAAPGERLIN